MACFGGSRLPALALLPKKQLSCSHLAQKYAVRKVTAHPLKQRKHILRLSARRAPLPGKERLRHADGNTPSCCCAASSLQVGAPCCTSHVLGPWQDGPAGARRPTRLLAHLQHLPQHEGAVVLLLPGSLDHR